jgi:hypothetical protein
MVSLETCFDLKRPSHYSFLPFLSPSPHPDSQHAPRTLASVLTAEFLRPVARMSLAGRPKTHSIQRQAPWRYFLTAGLSFVTCSWSAMALRISTGES